MRWRSEVLATDPQAVRRLVRSTSFFSSTEIDIAVELVDETLTAGHSSGYQFIFAEPAAIVEDLLGYACYGRMTPPRHNAFDLYWIVVSPDYQNRGLGKKLLQYAEEQAIRQGALEMYIDTSGREQYSPTRHFYERAGYTVHEVFPGFYSPGDDKVVYRKYFRSANDSCSEQQRLAEAGTRHSNPEIP